MFWHPEVTDLQELPEPMAQLALLALLEPMARQVLRVVQEPMEPLVQHPPLHRQERGQEVVV